MSNFLTSTILACGLLGMGAAHAHDLWIERAASLHTLVYGHEHAGHAGAKSLEYKPETVKQALCFAGSGQEVDGERGKGYPATLKGDCAASWFLMSSGYWSKTPYGTKNLPKSEAGAVLDSWYSVESVKRIDQWGSGLAKPLTQELELAPQENPLKLQAGDKLHLRVFDHGKPAAGVTVAYFGKPRGVTDADGNINIRLQNPGFQSLRASLESPLNDAKADKAIRSSGLQFEIKLDPQ